MLFNSWQFLFIFLPIALVGLTFLFHAKQGRFAPLWLLLGSLFFYSYWNYHYLSLLLVSILFNFTIAKVMSDNWILGRRVWLITGIVINLLLIVFYKYADFLGLTIAQLFGKSWINLNVVLPLGISFFTFTQIAYLVDTYRSDQAEKNIVRYSLFVSIFPHLIAGPILHYKDIAPQFLHRNFGNVTAENLSKGLTLFVIGLFKKVVIADNLALFVSPIFSAAGQNVVLTYAEAWIGALSYTLQLYFDFSGYSDMAVGLGWLFGLKLPWNFDSPYKALNIQEFWKKWHITLSFFMRDYVYFPLGGSRCLRIIQYRNIILTMLLCGLWHGANWTFVLWGMLHGIYMIIHRLWELTSSIIFPYLKNTIGNNRRDLSHSVIVLTRVLSRAVTFLAVLFAWVLFRSPNLATAKEVWWAMIGGNGFFLPSGFFKYESVSYWLEKYGIPQGQLFMKNEILLPQFTLASIVAWLTVSIIIVWFIPNCREWMEKQVVIPKVLAFDSIRDLLIRKFGVVPGWQPNKTWLLVLVVLTVISIMSLANVSEFLYFQF